ncbi:MAG: hypothetical protein V4642_01085 [Bacteroidota bacterium]
MVSLHPQYITDTAGNKVSVVLSMQEFQKIMDELEELDDIRLYDEAKNDNDTLIPLEEAFAIVDAKRKTA